MRIRKRAKQHVAKPRGHRRRRMQSILLAGATACFAPHAARAISKSHSHAPFLSVSGNTREAIPAVTTATEFRLPPELAYEGVIQEAATRYRMDPNLIRAVIAAESAFDPMAVSAAGAQGLMQLMPALAQQFGVVDPFDPRQNIMAGTRYLSQLLAAYRGSIELALASYNAGPGAVEFYNGVPPFPETLQYIKTITGSLSVP